jgi:hypothetical protein
MPKSLVKACLTFSLGFGILDHIGSEDTRNTSKDPMPVGNVNDVERPILIGSQRHNAIVLFFRH